MMKRKIWQLGFGIVMGLSGLSLEQCVLAQGGKAHVQWEKRLDHAVMQEIRDMAFDSQGDPYILTAEEVWKYDSEQEDWMRLFYQTESQCVFTRVDVDADGVIFVLTSDGLWISYDQGGAWTRECPDPRRESCGCSSLAVLNNVYYLGTSDGLFVKTRNDKKWRRCGGNDFSFPVRDIVVGKNRELIIAFSHHVVVWDPLRDQHRVIFEDGIGMSQDENGLEVENGFGNEEQIVLRTGILDLAMDLSGRDMALLVDWGIFSSVNNFSGWRRLSGTGIQIEDIKDVCAGFFDSTKNGHVPATIFSVSSDDVFVWDDGVWRSMRQGLEGSEIFKIAVNPVDGLLWAVTDAGVYALLETGFFEPAADPQTWARAQDLWQTEPTINDVHRMAIAYAEVDNQKIKTWRHEVRQKAWLPKFSVGVDGDKNRTLADSVWGTYSSGGQQYIGSDDKTIYDNWGWSVALSWDLSELIWNDDQLSIDSRSKYLVELREEILTQVTRLYFERRKIQLTLQADSLSEQGVDVYEQKMRLDELTAMIDSLTGGDFSKKIIPENVLGNRN